MKKLITIVLILALLLPAAALADSEEDLLGSWVGEKELSDGSMSIFYVRFFIDHTALYLTRGYELSDIDGIDLATFGTWDLRDDGVHLFIPNRMDSKKTVESVFALTEDHSLAIRLASSYIILVKLPDSLPISDVKTVTSWR